MDKADKLLATVKAKGLLTLTDAACLVAGELIVGSWWGHPKGKEIFRAVTALDEHDEIRSLKLVGGRQTFVHRRLWPALLRVASERSLFKEPSAAAVRALGKLDGKIDRKLRDQLERALLVIGHSEHTPEGHHEVRLKPFAEAFPVDSRKAAKKLKLDDAVAMLEDCGWSVPR